MVTVAECGAVSILPPATTLLGNLVLGCSSPRPVHQGLSAWHVGGTEEVLGGRAGHQRHSPFGLIVSGIKWFGVPIHGLSGLT